MSDTHKTFCGLKFVRFDLAGKPVGPLGNGDWTLIAVGGGLWALGTLAVLGYFVYGAYLKLGQ